jgi:hypothetical protein
MKTKVNISFSVSDAALLEQVKNLVFSIDADAAITAGEVVYSCENGGDYTAEDVKEEIRIWMSNNSPFRLLEPTQQARAVEIVYPILLGCLTWQCPSTLLQEWDDDDIADVMEKLESEFGKIVFSKDQVIEYLGDHGYDMGDLAEDRNLFWEVVREFFDYDETNNVFTLVGRD